MKAIGFTTAKPLTDPTALTTFERPTPHPTGHDLLVAVEAVSVNPVDLVAYHAPVTTTTPKIVGWDAVGTVTAIGDDVHLFQAGDRVFYAGSFSRSGSFTTAQLVDERIVGHAPTTLDIAQSAAMPLTSLTAYEALFEQLGITTTPHHQAETILIINGAGGVGSIATQLAHWAGLTVISTASRPETIAWTKAHGADYVVNHRHDLVTQVHNLGMPTVDYVLELSNLNQHWSEIVSLIKPNGHVASITGNETPLDLRALKQKRVTFAWEWMFTKSFYQTPDLITQHEILDQIATLLDQGVLQTTRTSTLTGLTPANVRTAWQRLADHHTIGKIVITQA